MSATTTFGTGFTTCIFGRVQVNPSNLVGAVNGTITPLFSSPIPITQVVGPSGGQISLNRVNGQFATVCGTFTPSTLGCALNVSTVVPFSFGGGLGTAPGLGI